jgi:hypothetical protein
MNVQGAPSVQRVLFSQFITVTANAYTCVFSHAYSFPPLCHHDILSFDSTLLTLVYHKSPPVMANTATYLITILAVTEKNDSACVGV